MWSQVCFLLQVGIRNKYSSLLSSLSSPAGASHGLNPGGSQKAKQKSIQVSSLEQCPRTQSRTEREKDESGGANRISNTIYIHFLKGSPGGSPSFFNKFIYLIYLFLSVLGLRLLHANFLQLKQVRATLSCGVQASCCGGFSCCGAWALGAWASVVVAHGLSSCGAWAQLLHGMWDLPGPGLKPVSPALAGGFLTTAPPGKPNRYIFNYKRHIYSAQKFCQVQKSVKKKRMLIISQPVAPVASFIHMLMCLFPVLFCTYFKQLKSYHTGSFLFVMSWHQNFSWGENLWFRESLRN